MIILAIILTTLLIVAYTPDMKFKSCGYSNEGDLACYVRGGVGVTSEGKGLPEEFVYSGEVRLSVEKGEQRGSLLIHYQKEGDFYQVEVNADQDMVDLRTGPQGGWKQLGKKDLPIELNTWYKLSVRKEGGTYTVSLDGTELFTVTDLEAAGGRFGIRAWADFADFRNIDLTTPDGSEPEVDTAATGASAAVPVKAGPISGPGNLAAEREHLQAIKEGRKPLDDFYYKYTNSFTDENTFVRGKYTGYTWLVKMPENLYKPKDYWLVEDEELVCSKESCMTWFEATPGRRGTLGLDFRVDGEAGAPGVFYLFLSSKVSIEFDIVNKKISMHDQRSLTTRMTKREFTTSAPLERGRWYSVGVASLDRGFYVYLDGEPIAHLPSMGPNDETAVGGFTLQFKGNGPCRVDNAWFTTDSRERFPDRFFDKEYDMPRKHTFHATVNRTLTFTDEIRKWKNYLEDGDGVQWTYRARTIVPYDEIEGSGNDIVWASARIKKWDMGAFGIGQYHIIKIADHVLRVVWISEDGFDVVEFPAHLYDVGEVTYELTWKAPAEYYEEGDFYIYYGNRDDVPEHRSLPASPGFPDVRVQAAGEENLMPDLIEYWMGIIPLGIIGLLLVVSVLLLPRAILARIGIWPISQGTAAAIAGVGGLIISVAGMLLFIANPYIYMVRFSDGKWWFYMIHEGKLLLDNLAAIDPSLWYVAHLMIPIFFIGMGMSVGGKTLAKDDDDDDEGDDEEEEVDPLAGLALGMGLLAIPIAIFLLVLPISIVGAFLNFGGMVDFYWTLYTLAVLWSVILCVFFANISEGQDTGRHARTSWLGYPFFLFFLVKLGYELAERYFMLNGGMDVHDAAIEAMAFLPPDIAELLLSPQFMMGVLALNLLMMFADNLEYLKRSFLLGIALLLALTILPMGFEKPSFEIVFSMAYLGSWFIGFGMVPKKGGDEDEDEKDDFEEAEFVAALDEDEDEGDDVRRCPACDSVLVGEGDKCPKCGASLEEEKEDENEEEDGSPDEEEEGVEEKKDSSDDEDNEDEEEEVDEDDSNEKKKEK